MNAVEKLVREIMRVTEIKGHFESLRGMKNVVVEPQIAMMNEVLDRACKAVGSGDALECLRMITELEGYSE